MSGDSSSFGPPVGTVLIGHMVNHSAPKQPQTDRASIASTCSVCSIEMHESVMLWPNTIG